MDWISWLQGIVLVVLNNLVLLFWKPWAGAYAGEKGKNFARKEDLDAILAEVRAVTVTQREIEAKISSEVWDRQTKWREKRDTYAGLIRVSNGLCLTMSKLIKALPGSEEANRLAAERMKLLGEVMHYESLIGIFGNDQAIAAIDDFTNSPSDAEAETGACFQLRQRITEIAKQDLGLVEQQLSASRAQGNRD